MSAQNSEAPFYFTTLELMNMETLISQRIFEGKRDARNNPNQADIHLEMIPGYEQLNEKIRGEIDKRFDAMREANAGALFTVNSNR